LNIEIPEINTLIHTVSQLERRIAEIEDKFNPNQEWFSLKEACSLKGLNYNTVSSRLRLQPNKGQEDAIIAGRRRWRRETILKWLNETDHDISNVN